MRRLEHRRDGPASPRWRWGVRASGRWRGFSFCDRARAANRLRLGPLFRPPPNGALWRSLPQTRKFGRQPPVVVNPLQPREFAGILFGVLLYFPGMLFGIALYFLGMRILQKANIGLELFSQHVDVISQLLKQLGGIVKFMRNTIQLPTSRLYQSKTPETRDRSR